MSCRIDRTVEERDRLILRVSGRIEAENVDVFRELLGREKGGVSIDLREVILVDREVVSFLAVSEKNGIQLRNCPAYIREWVDREKVRMDTEHQE